MANSTVEWADFPMCPALAREFVDHDPWFVVSSSSLTATFGQSPFDVSSSVGFELVAHSWFRRPNYARRIPNRERIEIEMPAGATNS